MKNIFLFILVTCLNFSSLSAQIKSDILPKLDTLALEKQMAAYYAEAAELNKEMPKLDLRGFYGGISAGLVTMPTDAIKEWVIQKTCDCTGKVIRIDSLEQSGEIVLRNTALNVEWQPTNAVSIRLSASRNRYNLDSGNLVYAENNRRSSLREPLKMTQYMLQSALKFNLSTHFYLGGGVTWSHFTLNKALTNAVNEEASANKSEAPPQYARVLIDDNNIKNNRWTPNAFIGYKANILDTPWQTTLEMGVQHKKLYVSFQVLVPISRRLWQNAQKRRDAYAHFMSVYDKANRINYQLHPERFQSRDTSNDDDNSCSDGGSSSGGDSGGSSSGGGCGNGNN